MNARDFVGTWYLVSFVGHRTDGSAAREPWGPAPTGRLIYTADGHVAAVLTKPDRVCFASADPTGGTQTKSKRRLKALRLTLAGTNSTKPPR